MPPAISGTPNPSGFTKMPFAYATMIMTTLPTASAPVMTMSTQNCN